MKHAYDGRLDDGDGRRVSKSNGKLYWYGAGGDILAETDGSGNTTAEYIFGVYPERSRGSGKRIAMLPAGSSPMYYVEDMLGTSRVITTSAGVVCGVYPERSRRNADFYPGVYPERSRRGGERTVTNTCPQNNYKFEGKERDAETGNDDFGARYYSNRFGRWLSADWSAVPVPVPYANLTNPQTLNLYAMVADDPETFADLDGHDPPVEPQVVEEIEELANDPAVVSEVLTGLATGSEVVTGAVTAAIATPITLAAAGGLLIQSFASKNQAEADLQMQETAAANDVALRKQQQQPSVVPNPQMAEHKKGARPSTTEDHEAGKTRKKRDAGGEKGDQRRARKGMYPRRPPGGKQPEGGWPPKPKPTEPPKPPKPPEPAQPD